MFLSYQLSSGMKAEVTLALDLKSTRVTFYCLDNITCNLMQVVITYSIAFTCIICGYS